jgi:hypothetical protein
MAAVTAFLLWCGVERAVGGVLKGSFSPIPSGTDINLTAAGQMDWVHWGLYTDTSLDRKAGVAPQISNFNSVYDTGNSQAYVYAYQYTDNPNSYSWSDGTPSASLTNTTTGVWAYGSPQVGTGFQISVPADTTVRTLKVYVSVFAAEGLFVGSLSDGSATDYRNSSLHSRRNTEAGVYSLEYAANSPGQTLTVWWTLIRSHSASANVTLQSAALTATNANNPPFVSITSPTENATFNTETNIIITANATDLAGTITKVEFFDGSTKLATLSSGPYAFTWNNAPAGHHVLTAVATDNNSDFSISKPVEIFINGTGGSLSINRAEPPSTVDLTLEGEADWAHWGLSTDSSFDHKAGVSQQISNLSVVGTNLLQRYADNLTSYTWGDGTPNLGATNTTTGVFITGLNNGFQIHAPADINSRRLTVYVGLYGSQGIFQAYLSDFSAPAFTDTSLSNIFDNSYAAYTLDYKAASAGQSLIIKFRSLVLFDQHFGNVTLQAATLVGTNSGPANIPPIVSITSPTNGTSFIAPASITILASASDSDGSVTNIQIFNGTTAIHQSTSNTCNLVWKNVGSGPYSLTARVTDNLGVSTLSTPVDITVITSAYLQLQYQLIPNNGTVGLRIFPTVAQPYSLDSSTNLTNWVSIFTNQTGATASNFIQWPITNSSGRFFRGKRWP